MTKVSALTVAVAATTISITASADAPDWQQFSVSQLNDRIMAATKAINAREYAEACSELRILPQDVDSRQPQLTYNIWFLLGQCHAGLGLFEEARDYFIKVVDADPTAARPRLDLAMVQQYLGDYDAANDQYDYLLDVAELDEPVHDKVEEIYDQRPDALKYYFEAGFGIINDSNVNYGPDAEVLTIYGTDLALNSQSRPISSSGSKLDLNLSAEKLLSRYARVSAGLSIEQISYSEDSGFDSRMVDLHAAYRHKLWSGEYMIQPRYVDVSLGSESLFNVMALEGAYAWLQTNNLRLTGTGSYKNYSYSIDSDRNTSEMGLQFLTNYRMNSKLLLNSRLGYSQGSAAVDAYSYSDMLLALGFDYALMPNLLLTVNFETSQTAYSGTLEAFDTTRSDTRTRFSSELSYNLQGLGSWGKRFTVDLGMRNYTNSSNVALYENSRNQTWVTLRATL
ncbi:surface lipoprotein assembly modifier [Oceanobacter mangrovi]|uniref:surface lipoprotein assembly modifier n=1 Tax=Oceanobacter mangrovi TaxID=2862510 RepID=UPI001C8D1D31|nr:surface lipoprotein assembly modifier [Oceanobacter mangrovi]